MKKILVVDDSSTIRKMVSLTLKKAKHISVTAEDGVDGFKKAEQEAFDLIITDINMPRLDGLQLCKQLRKRAGPNQNSPIVVLTTESCEKKKKIAREERVAGWLKKPFSPETLLRVIDKFAK